jgi:hypothetical protein
MPELIYTPNVMNTPTRFEQEIEAVRLGLESCC